MKYAEKKFLISYGRTKARKLTPNQQRLFDELLPKIQISLKNPALGWQNQSAETWLEIGFGDGGHLAHQARNNPNVNFIGCEPFINGAVKLLREIEDNNLQNIRIYTGDVRDLLEKTPENSISRIFILNPDPWPKTKHHKRRLIQKPLLDLLEKVLQPEGMLRIATDDEDYAFWILKEFMNHPKFLWTVRSKADWQNDPDDHIKTKYQKKAFKEGRKNIFIEYKLLG
ncbi:MAG: tRNA (guanosine(46)-N7)-methyltransferase TrmB [Alphaproteobacteria bacterium CG11_big_fil_rev_8_21_14_0_20_44_7]|nr:MAG: tRNA (guanosine(46)-N7)-methyltransferase TrmB [Alphaproteobacteria bacterium CG11_big_fil_rev_8_21_14_0_20_44_7]